MSRGRPGTSFRGGGGSADADILEDLPKLRERSRDMIRNDPYAKGLINLVTSNVIGSGIRPQPQVDAEAAGLTPAQAQAFEEEVAKIWARWARQSDVTGQLDEAARQRLTFRSCFENGDVFLISRRVEGRPSAVAVEVVEGDRIDTPNGDVQQGLIRGGVEIGPKGEPLAYHVLVTHPGDSSWINEKSYKRIPRLDENGRDQMLHVMRVDRAGQSRGVPWLDASIDDLHDLGQLKKALLMAEKIAACFAAFVTTPDPIGQASAGGDYNSTSERRETNLRPGMIEYLDPGQKIEFGTPNRNGGSISEFIARYIRGVGSANSIPYELLSQDFSKTNYSSGRMALNEARRYFRELQQWFASVAIEPFYKLLIEEAILSGKLVAPNWAESPWAYTSAEWIGQGWSWIDPQKEVAAIVAAIDGNLSSLQREAAAHGLDWEAILRQRAREKELMAELMGPEEPEVPDEPGDDEPPDEPDDDEPDEGDGDDDGTEEGDDDDE